MTSNLYESWRELWLAIGGSSDQREVFVELTAAYSSPGRYYHTLLHIEDCLNVFARATHLAEHPHEVELAIFFHDAIYDNHLNDNEQKSGDWARRVITGAALHSTMADRVATLILATCHTGSATGVDAQLLVDVDLSILGSEPDKFWQYEQNIRKEYEWVPLSSYTMNRSEILRHFLNRSHIYQLDLFRQLYEQQARQNIQNAIAHLAGTT